MQDEGLRRAEGEGAGVGAHFVIVLSEHVEALVLVLELGHVEVRDLQPQPLPLRRHQDVVGLQVPVDHPVLVQVHHAPEQLPEQPAGDRLC